MSSEIDFPKLSFAQKITYFKGVDNFGFFAHTFSDFWRFLLMLALCYLIQSFELFLLLVFRDTFVAS